MQQDLRNETLLLRPVDQDDIGVLLRTVEHNVFSVRRNVEAAQAALVRQLCELSLLPDRAALDRLP